MINTEDTEPGDMAGRKPATTPSDVLDAFDERDDVAEPFTAPELAEALNCSRRTALNKLHTLANDDEVKSKQVGGRAKVWWRPLPREGVERPAHGAPDAFDGADLQGDASTTLADDADAREGESSGEKPAGVDVETLSFGRDLTPARREQLDAWLQYAAGRNAGVAKADFKAWWTDDRAGPTGYNAGSFWEAFAKAAMKQSDRFMKPDSRTYRYVDA